jgi:hypothetical protein
MYGVHDGEKVEGNGDNDCGIRAETSSVPVLLTALVLLEMSPLIATVIAFVKAGVQVAKLKVSRAFTAAMAAQPLRAK